jgi:hypothetical protein
LVIMRTMVEIGAELFVANTLSAPETITAQSPAVGGYLSKKYDNWTWSEHRSRVIWDDSCQIAWAGASREGSPSPIEIFYVG